MSTAKPVLRSTAWFGSADKNGFMYRSWMKNQGIPDHEFQGKPIIGICNTWIELDCASGRLQLDITDDELTARLAAWEAAKQPLPADGAGYRKLYVEHVLQADEGCDFDFLVGCRGADVPSHSH